jgi:hypothetical protein
MDWTTIVGVVISIGTISTFLITGVRWLVKHYFDDMIHELKPNSGSSMKDQITRLEQTTKRLEQEHVELNISQKGLDDKITKIYDTLLAYVTKNN